MVLDSLPLDISPDLPDPLSGNAVLLGGNLGAIVNLAALIVALPLLVTGGLVAGLAAALLAPGMVRGPVNGLAAAAFTGFLSGATVAFTGALVGLYNEPPMLLADGLFLVPMFDHLGLAGPPLILAVIALLVAADGLVGALFGGLLGAGIQEFRGRVSAA